MSRFFIAGLSIVIASCMHTTVDDDAMLWNYYEVTSPDPQMALKVRDSVVNRDMKEFLLGLSFRDAYRKKSELHDFVEAETIFKGLIATNKKVYYGYLGRGLMFTEAGMRLTEKIQDTERQSNFDSAAVLIQKAINQASKINKEHPHLPMLYFYMGKNEFYRYRTYKHNDEINLRAIYYLDTAIQKKAGFYKAYLRYAQYLSQYAIIAKANNNSVTDPQADSPDDLQGNSGTDTLTSRADSLRVRAQARADSLRKSAIVRKTAELEERISRVHDRLRYLFAECLRLNKRAEVYLSMAKAGLTYSRFQRLSFLAAAADLQDTSAALTIKQETSQIYYSELKSYSDALKHYAWLQPSDSGVQRCLKEPCRHNAHHWVAISWSLFHTYEVDSAFELLTYRIANDPGHGEQYWYARGMMLNQQRDFAGALLALQKAREIAEKHQTPHGFICFEIAKVFLTLHKRQQALDLLVYLTEKYDGTNDPHFGETKENASYMKEFYELNE